MQMTTKSEHKKPMPSSAPFSILHRSLQPGGMAAAEHSAAATEHSQEEAKVIGAVPARAESSDKEAPATEQRRDRRARPKPPAVAPPAKLQRHAGLILALPPPLPLEPQQQQQQQQQEQQQRFVVIIMQTRVLI